MKWAKIHHYKNAFKIAVPLGANSAFSEGSRCAVPVMNKTYRIV